MRKHLTLGDVYEEYICYLQTQLPSNQSKSRIDQFSSVVLRTVVPGLGHQRQNPAAKMTQIEKTAAIAYLKTLPARDIVKVLEALHRGFELLGTSQASRNNYAPRILEWYEWSTLQPWYPGPKRSATDLRCPPMLTGRGAASKQKLTHRTKRYPCYRLRTQQQSPGLQAALVAVHSFLTDPHHPDRLMDHKAIKAASARLYGRNAESMLGYRAYHDANPIAIADLQLSDLVPLVEEDSLDHLTRKECQQLWKQQRKQFSDWWERYKIFLRHTCESISPRTRVNKLCALIAIAKFLYRYHVSWESGYTDIPIIQLLYSYLKAEMREAAEWTAMRRTVVKGEQKWIERREGQTTLAAIWEQVIVPLQQETRLRDQWGQLRKGRAIAKSCKSFIIWHRMGSYPAARQSVLRTQKIAMYCPIERPAEVPPEGWYWPKVPLECRECDLDQRPIDNCLYRTYTHQGQSYPEGVYILEVCGYKTEKRYGSQQYVIANQQFDDGTWLYDVYERYLCGQWLPEGNKHDLLYDWWVQEWRGRRGRWVTKGRMEFEPAPQLQPLGSVEGEGVQSAWGYWFVNPLTGKLPSETSFAKAFEAPAFRLTGKRVTPHIMRSVWATWGLEMGLTEHQLLALAYAMGHSLDTLRRVYERTTPEEKRRPIEQVIHEVVLGQAEDGAAAAATPLEEAMAAFERLSPEDQLLLKYWLDSPNSPAA